MLTHDELVFIEHSIETLKNDFINYPNKYLTEDDLRFHLCYLLLERYGEHGLTDDRDISIPLHTEVRWYGSDNKLKFRSDIVIIDVASLVVRSKASFKLPSKGYGFEMPKAIIELKLRRPNGESDYTYKDKIEGDCEKLERIRNNLLEGRIGGNIYCHAIAFDKKSQLSNFKTFNNVNLTYAVATNT